MARALTFGKYSGVRGKLAREALISARSSATRRPRLATKIEKSTEAEPSDATNHHSLPSSGGLEAVTQFMVFTYQHKYRSMSTRTYHLCSDSHK